VEVFHKYLHKYIVQHNADGYHHKIPEQLYAAPDIGFREYDIFAEKETGRECYRHRHEQGAYMRTHIKQPEMKGLMTKHKIVTNKVQEYIQCSIPPSAGEIAESLKWHYLRKRWIQVAQDL
jgi:hypothetical protein